MEDGGEFPKHAIILDEHTQKGPEPYPIYSSLDRGTQKDDFLSSEELVVQTDEFMRRFGKMLERQELPDTIFFLDKSARPIAYMFRKLFPVYYPETKIPEIRYVNIGGSGSRLYDSEARPFTGNPDIIRQTYGEPINKQGKITIVDEYSHTGQALEHATDVISRAFSQATITTMVAYNKLPNWYQNTGYLGVEEYTKYDYENMALQRLNQELGTSYKNRLDMVNDRKQPDTVSYRFWELYEELVGKIPYVKRGRHIFTHYKYPVQSILQKIKGEKPPPVEVKTNVFRKAREELDTICIAVLQQRQQREQIR